MRDGYDIFEREGKTRIRVWGKDEKELFARALLGLAAYLRPDVVPAGTPAVAVRAHLCGEGLSDTLRKFLEHVLFESEMHDAVFSAMDVISLLPGEIECELAGRKVSRLEEEVARVELGQIERPADNRWEAEFVVRI